jgi:predicted CopG family antitoxin
MSSKTITIPDELYERLQVLAGTEGTKVEALVTKAIERDLARRWLKRVEREVGARRGHLTDDEIEAAVQSTVQDVRARSK